MVSTATNVASHKQVLLYNTSMKEKDFILFLFYTLKTAYIKNFVLPLTVSLRKNMLSTNILLIHNFTKRYETVLLLNFIVSQN